LFFWVINDDVEGVDLTTTGDLPKLVILLSDESDFANGSYETSLSESSKISTYINYKIPYLDFV